MVVPAHPPLPVARVPFPLMPKGVEQDLIEGDSAIAAVVPFPLMPKGVEQYRAAMEAAWAGQCLFL